MRQIMSVTEYTLVHLDIVEAESIYNLREVVTEFVRWQILLICR